MSRRVSFLLWVALGCLAGVAGMQVFLTRSALREAEAGQAELQKAVNRAESALAVTRQMAARLAERRDSGRDPQSDPTLNAEERLVESLRRKLVELERRHPRAEWPPPLTNPFGPNYTAELLADPAFAQVYRTWYGLRIEKDYNALLATLSAPLETKTKLLELLLDQQIQHMDMMAVTGSSRWAPGNLPTEAQRREDEQASERQREQFAAQVEALLGAPAYGQFVAYAENYSRRREAGWIAERLSYTGEPLTPAQRAQLMALPDVRFFDARGEAAEKVQASLRGILSPAQMQDVQQLQRERTHLQERSRK